MTCDGALHQHQVHPWPMPTETQSDATADSVFFCRFVVSRDSIQIHNRE